MYGIFAPLDPDERLPREMVEEGRRYKTVGRRELAGFMWFPTVFVLLAVFGWTGPNLVIALIASVCVLGGLFLFAFSGGR
jgi:hypothetical protein